MLLLPCAVNVGADPGDESNPSVMGVIKISVPKRTEKIVTDLRSQVDEL